MQPMNSAPVFLTEDEASCLQEAVERLVSTGIRVHDSEFEIHAGGGEAETMSSEDAGSNDPAADFSGQYGPSV
jgi:hypothetical protein